MSTNRSISSIAGAAGSRSTCRVKTQSLLATASFVAGGFVWMSLPAKASTYFHGGSDGYFVPVLAKTISCRSGVDRRLQYCWFSAQIRLALRMPTMPCAAGESCGTAFSV